MRYQQLGASGLTVSGVGLGCNTFGDTVPGERVSEIVHAVLDAGVTFFDSADLYGSCPGQLEYWAKFFLGRATMSFSRQKLGWTWGGPQRF